MSRGKGSDELRKSLILQVRKGRSVSEAGRLGAGGQGGSLHAAIYSGPRKDHPLTISCFVIESVGIWR